MWIRTLFRQGKRGLVLLRGTDKDGEIGSESNGSGKLSLDALVLWDLMGFVDLRTLLQDSRVSNVINDGHKVRKGQGKDKTRGGRRAKLCPSVATSYIITSFHPSQAVKNLERPFKKCTPALTFTPHRFTFDPPPPTCFHTQPILTQLASVSVRGTTDSTPFVIARTKTSTGGGLALILYRRDVTCQYIRYMQRDVDVAGGVNYCILARTVFHGQHLFDGLLEASDVRLKKELNLVFPIYVWRGGTSNAQSAAKEEARQSADLGGMIYLQRGDVVAMRGRVKTVMEEGNVSMVEYESMKVEKIESV